MPCDACGRALGDTVWDGEDDERGMFVCEDCLALSPGERFELMLLDATLEVG